MRIVRLPGIHHDANAVLVMGQSRAILVDTGTSWYQLLQSERIKGHLGTNVELERILLSSRRFPFSGASLFISQNFREIPVFIGEAGVSAMETGDFFTTWANRYDSDMQPVSCESLLDGDIFELDEMEMACLHTPGQAPEGTSFYIEDRSILCSASVMPRADTPSRWDLPGGCLPDLVESVESIIALEVETLVPARGPSMKGRTHINEVCQRHLDFYNQVVERGGEKPRGWRRPSRTAWYHTPPSPWPLVERENPQKG